MKKLLALLLLSPLVVSEGFNFDLAKEFVLKDLDKLTSLRPQCVGFYFEKYNEIKTKISFEIREVHNEECGGDTGTAPMVAMVYVLDTEEVFVFNLLCNDYYRIEEYSWDMDCNG
tara:strand:+ start:230 stop:574 length:345 start_codon:yes stop_codon:yes gene_type:complete